MTGRERDDAQMWVTLVFVSLAIAACLALLAPVVERAVPGLKGLAAGPAGSETACGNCGVIEDVRERQAAASRQDGAAQTGGRAGIVMIILGALGGNFHVDPAKVYEIEVRMRDGSVRTFQSTAVPASKPGDRVKVFGGRIEQVS